MPENAKPETTLDTAQMRRVADVPRTTDLARRLLHEAADELDRLRAASIKAEDLRCAAREVSDQMRRTPGGDAFEYHGSTEAVDNLIDKLNALEHFQAGWV